MLADVFTPFEPMPASLAQVVLEASVFPIEPDEVLAEELAQVGDRHQRERDAEQGEDNAHHATELRHRHRIAVT